MLVDIHTHSCHSATHSLAVINLNLNEAEDFFKSDKQAHCSVGIHPWHADSFPIDMLSKLEKWSKDKRFIAMGECGLDKNSSASFEKQLSIFEAQITISEKSNKPLIIHCVGYFNELLALKKNGTRPSCGSFTVSEENPNLQHKRSKRAVLCHTANISTQKVYASLLPKNFS